MSKKRGMRSLTVPGFLAVLGLVPVGRAPGGEIPPNRVPRAVMNAARVWFPGAEITAASEETEDGMPTVYDLEMKHNRHEVDVTFKGDGTVVLVETSVPKKELPKVILRAVAYQYPGAGFRGASSVKNGPEVKRTADYYQFYLVSADNKPRLVKMDPKGKVLEDPYRRVRRAQPYLPLSRSPATVGR